MTYGCHFSWCRVYRHGSRRGGRQCLRIPIKGRILSTRASTGMYLGIYKGNDSINKRQSTKHPQPNIKRMGRKRSGCNDQTAKDD